MRYLISIILITLSYSSDVQAFSSGAGTCFVVADYSNITAMQNRVRNPNSGSYTITSNSPNYSSSQPIELTISGPVFTGIMVQLVDENGVSVGSFDTNDSQVVDCQGSALSVTHSTAHGNVMTRSVFWIPPAESVGTVYVQAYILSGTRGNQRSQQFYRFVRDDDSAISIQAQEVEESDFQINQGIAGTWFFPETSGSGFLLDVRPADNFMFVAWFTHDFSDENRADDDTGGRWFTASGNYSGGVAGLDLFETTGGLFDNPQAVSTTSVGNITFNFTECATGEVTYEFTDRPELGRTFPIQRAVPGTESLCESLIETATK